MHGRGSQKAIHVNEGCWPTVDETGPSTWAATSTMCSEHGCAPWAPPQCWHPLNRLRTEGLQTCSQSLAHSWSTVVHSKVDANVLSKRTWSGRREWTRAGQSSDGFRCGRWNKPGTPFRATRLRAIRVLPPRQVNTLFDPSSWGCKRPESCPWSAIQGRCTQIPTRNEGNQFCSAETAASQVGATPSC